MATTNVPVMPDLIDETGEYIFRMSFMRNGKRIVSKNGKPFKIRLKG